MENGLSGSSLCGILQARILEWATMSSFRGSSWPKDRTQVSYISCTGLVQFSHSVVSDFLWPHELQHTRPPCPSPTARIYPNPCPSSRWCHPTISSSVVPFSSCLQSFPESRSFQMSQLFSRKNAFESILMRWMNLEPFIQSELSQKKKNKYHLLTYIYGI